MLPIDMAPIIAAIRAKFPQLSQHDLEVLARTAVDATIAQFNANNYRYDGDVYVDDVFIGLHTFTRIRILAKKDFGWYISLEDECTTEPKKFWMSDDHLRSRFRLPTKEEL